MAGASKPVDVSTKQQRIAELARQSPEMAFTSLAHSHRHRLAAARPIARTRKDGAVGVDGQDGEDYAVEPGGQPSVAAGPSQVRHVPGTAGAASAYPEGRLGDRDPAARDSDLRGQGPSAGGRHGAGSDLRAGLPGLLVRLPAGTRSAHQALDSLWKQTMGMGGGWIVEVDIRKFFDTIDHGHLREFLKRRVRDGVLLRLIGKWLNAGVLEDGMRHASRTTARRKAGLISPISWPTSSCTTCWTNGSSGRCSPA